MAGHFNYQFINQFSHGAGAGSQGRHHDAAQYYNNPIFNQLNWMMQSQNAAAHVTHCKYNLYKQTK